MDLYSPTVLDNLKVQIENWDPNVEPQEKLFFIKNKLHKTLPVLIKLLSPKKVINDRNLFKIVMKEKDDDSNTELVLLNRYCYFIVNNNLQISISSDSSIELTRQCFGVGTTEPHNLLMFLPELVKGANKKVKMESKLNIKNIINILTYINTN